ncbi:MULTISPECIES: cupin domain-containing protein [Burkholderia]|uniref:cupin domain-containing protein n=1 Tax=Burkholderia TaxID=32008 RepID=UPI000AAD3EB3|nr:MULTISPECIES: cupin domain-containing protein [unclassified Burkholderia]
MTENSIPTTKPSDIFDLKTGIFNLLPKSGVVKVVNELPHEKNPIHFHENEETLLILEGSLKLYWQDQGSELFVEAHPGEKIFLPKGIPHYSEAGDSGCFYLITDRFVE